MNETIQLQLAHRSIRRYTSESIPSEMLNLIVQCGQAAATSSFVQAYSVVRVTDSDNRQAIAAAAGGQPWIEQAAEFLVFCADLRRISKACEMVGAESLDTHAEHSLVAIVDVALMAQNMVLAAESVGLSGTYIGGIRNAPQVIVDRLQLPELVSPVFGMCLGWPDQDVQTKPRMPRPMILHQDQYRDTSEDELRDYDQTVAAYYEARSSNIRTSNWSEQTAKAMQGKKREHMLSFLHQQGFFQR